MDSGKPGAWVGSSDDSGVSSKSRWGMLCYRGTGNLGDEIQSLAARRFLPRVDYLVERDNLAGFRGSSPDENVKIILNGWFCHHAGRFKLPRSIGPLFISMHITPAVRKRFSDPEVVKVLRQHGPVGARDNDTLTFLQSLNVESYLSSCLTLTLERPSVPETDDVILNDVPSTVVEKVRARTAQDLVLTAHSDDVQSSIQRRFSQAESLLRRYASARCVLTTRLHCALPCIAMGTPVLLLRGSSGQERFSGLLDLVQHCSVDDFLSGRVDWDPGAPSSNPKKHHGIREELVKRVYNFIDGSLK